MNRYSRYEDALIEQVRLIERYQTTVGLRYLQGFFEDMNSRHSPGVRMEVRTLAAIHVKTLLEAEPTYVAPEACDLVDRARETFEPEPVLASDPWVPSGFVLLPRPLWIDDAPITEEHPLRTPGGMVPIRAIAWMPMHAEDLSIGCFWISYFTHIDDEPEDRWVDRGASVDEIRRLLGPLSLVHQFQWSWGDDGWKNPDVVDGDSLEETLLRGKQQSALVQTLWRIGSQFTASKSRVPRQMYRDAARKGVDHRDVTIITLRRGREGAEYETDGGRTLHYQHLVRGYWARRHTREGVRQVWVRPHVRGSDDLPFRETTRAWEFVR